ncbi:hypothetical protein L208DRAFT_1383121 [Tricholoma matsutake]|nr:hypothetical protein L208DRAFT_1383121 [Tricholoma matsutake 945]
MTGKKNISKTWQANLPKWPPKHTPVSRKPTIDDVMNSKLESNFDSKDSEVESEEEMGSDDEDITLKEIQSDAELLEFAMRLQEAHDRMVTEEKAKQAKEVHLLGEFGQVKTEVAVARAKSRGGWFLFCDKVLPKADRATRNTKNLRISRRDTEEAPPIENGNNLATTGTEDEEEPKPETLDHHDLPALHRARAELVVRHKKKNLDLFFQV